MNLGGSKQSKATTVNIFLHLGMDYGLKVTPSVMTHILISPAVSSGSDKMKQMSGVTLVANLLCHSQQLGHHHLALLC